MDSKLKALKVAQLKEILQKANVSVAAKATKDTLISKIIDTPAAVDAYNAIYNPTAPAETVEEPASATVSEASPSTLPTEPVPTPPEPTSTSEAPAPVVDEEAEKRKARAARFGIPLVEPKVEEATKRKARGERLGAPTEKPNKNKKRPAPAEHLDPEEIERRRKRAERFNVPASS